MTWPRRPDRRARPDDSTFAGNLFAEGAPPSAGGAGVEVRDARPAGFFARIGAAGPVANGYAFERIDDADPAAAVAVLAGAEQQGDGAAVAAWERAGRADVPAGAVVWLEPLRFSAGYGFVYAGAAASSGSAPLLTALPSVGGLPQGNVLALRLTVPGNGTYVIYGSVSALVRATFAAGNVWLECVVTDLPGLFNGVRGQTFTVGFSAVSGALVAGAVAFALEPVRTTGPVDLLIRVYRRGNFEATWTQDRIDDGTSGFGDTFLAYHQVG